MNIHTVFTDDFFDFKSSVSNLLTLRLEFVFDGSLFLVLLIFDPLPVFWFDLI
jgi:hypothetical protein